MSHRSLQVDSDVDTKSLAGFKSDDISREGGLENLQNQLTSTLLENMPTAPDTETIMESFEKRRGLGEQEFESFRSLVKSKFGRGIEDVEEAGDRAAMGLIEGGRGFAQNTIVLKNLATDVEKRVRGLKKDRDDLILQANFEQARRLDDLIIKEQEAVTNAKTSFLNKLFAFSAETRAQRGFQTPQQKAIQDLALQFPDIVGLSDATNLNEALAAVAPTAERQRELETESQRLANALTSAQIGLVVEQTTQLTDPTGNFEDATGLRKEFIGQSKEFVTVRDAWGRIQASAVDPSAAGDLALIFNFMKVLDPGSVVREGEFANAANSAGIPSRLRAQYNKVLRGERLASNMRADFVDRAERLFGAQVATHNQLRSEYGRLAGNAGISAENVIIDYMIAGDTDDTFNIRFGISEDNLFFNITSQSTTQPFGSQ